MVPEVPRLLSRQENCIAYSLEEDSQMKEEEPSSSAGAGKPV